MKNLLKDDEDRIQTERKQEVTPPDLHTIYLTNQNELRQETTFLGTYFKLTNSIRIGKEMLPEKTEYDQLRREALALLKDKKIYPKDKKVALASDGNKYFVSSDTSGTIVVAIDKIKEGIDEASEQQASKIIPELYDIETRIFKGLIKEKIILVKRFDIKNMIGDILEEAVKEGMLEKLKEKMVKSDGKPT
jgi:hypothetical protein